VFFYSNELVHFYFALLAVTAADCLFPVTPLYLGTPAELRLPLSGSQNRKPKTHDLKPHPSPPLEDHFLRHSVDETQLRSSKILRTSLEKFRKEEMDGRCLAQDGFTRRENKKILSNNTNSKFHISFEMYYLFYGFQKLRKSYTFLSVNSGSRLTYVCIVVS